MITRERPKRRTTADYTIIAWQILATPKRIGIWEWMIEHGRIPASESSKPGPWLPEQALMFKRPLEVVTARLNQVPRPGDPESVRASMVIVCGPSQMGKTKSFLHPVVAYCIDVIRTNCAFITHKQKQIRAALRIRFLPMFEETPRLARYLPPTAALRRERLNSNLWQLEGANLHALCGNVASDLREYSHPVGVADEIEAYNSNVDGEGDPIRLFTDRQKRYREWCVFAAGSTPNIVTGHCWKLLCQGSHERLLIRCEACGHDQDLSPDQLRSTGDHITADQIERDDAAAWACKHCGVLHNSDAKDRMVREAVQADRWIMGTWSQDEHNPAGEWIPGTRWLKTSETDQERVDLATWKAAEGCERFQLISCPSPDHSRRTFHINYLHSIDCPCGRFLGEQIRASLGDAEQYHSFVTGWRAEPVITSGQMLSVDSILDKVDHRHEYGSGPEETTYLFIACDQQGNSLNTCWFAYEVRAVNANGGESWMVETGRVDRFDGLRALEERTWIIGDQRRHCDYIAVDGANGVMAKHIRGWAAESFAANLQAGMPPKMARQKVRRVLLVGDAHLSSDQPFVEMEPTKRTKLHHPVGCRIFKWSNLFYKDSLWKRLQGSIEEPLYHLPDISTQKNRDLDVFLKSCTSEERIFTQIGAPGGRKRSTFYWQERVVIDENGRETVRHDTHWWDAAAMCIVLADLVGAHRIRKVTKAPKTKRARKTPAAPAKQRRQISRLGKRRR